VCPTFYFTAKWRVQDHAGDQGRDGWTVCAECNIIYIYCTLSEIVGTALESPSIFHIFNFMNSTNSMNNTNFMNNTISLYSG